MKQRSEPTPSTALRVRIRVGGLLDDGWTSWFDGLAISPLETGDTSLHGTVADQASLHGLLSRIRDLGVPLLGLEVIEAAGDVASDEAPADRPEAPDCPHQPQSGARPA